MDESATAVREVYVKPGESHLVQEPAIFKTLLGSCVGITFLVPRLGIGALCHPVLPVCPPKSQNMTLEGGRRFVDFAIRDLARQLDQLKVRRSEVQVKVFGGADVLFVAADSRQTVGALNAECAVRVLEEEGFQVSASRVGGTVGIHIQFDTRSGEVLLRKLG
jgi:chemotaxis protein CheD